MNDSQIKVNENIEKYLDSYIKKEDVQYATLLTGKWGCGKTYFIKEYIKKYNDKFLYISLFGLKTIDDINDAIFGAIYPKLTSDKAKIAIGLLKSVTKIGFQFNLEELSIKDKIIDFLTKDKYIFVFDDLERSFVSYDEILGFINNLTENNSIKVILVANIDEIQEDSKRIFDKFKEKVINRTFIVQNNDRDFWEFYYEKYPMLKDFSDEIKDVFQKYSDNNFRLLIQATDDYLDFIENFKDTKFFKNDEFKKMLIKHFFSFCIFYKKSNNFDELKRVFFNGKYDHIFYEKFIFPSEIWKDVLTENKIDVDLILDSFGNLIIFQPLKERESWVKLWHYWELKPNDFYNVINDVKLKFKNFEYHRLDVLEHVYSLLILFIKNSVVEDLTVQEVLDIVDKYLSKNISNENWLNHKFGARFNGTGLGFQNQNDEDIIKLNKKLSQKIEERKQYIEKNNFRNDLDKILESIEKEDLENLYNILMKNEYNPVLNQIDYQKIFEILKNNPQSIFILCRTLDSRYSTNYLMNGRNRAEWLIDEKPFVEQMIIFLQGLEKDEQIDKFHAFRIRENIGFFQNGILPRFDGS